MNFMEKKIVYEVKFLLISFFKSLKYYKKKTSINKLNQLYGPISYCFILKNIVFDFRKEKKIMHLFEDYEI